MSKAGATAKKAAENGTTPGDDFKARLLAGDIELEHEELEVVGIGTFEIRAMTRAEVIEVSEHDKDGTGGYEARALTIGLVEPRMTYQEVRQWQKVAPAGLLQVLVERIQSLSGMEEGSRKEAIKQFRRKSE